MAAWLHTQRQPGCAGSTWLLHAFNDHLQSASTGQVRAAAGPSQVASAARPKALADLQQNELGVGARSGRRKQKVGWLKVQGP